MTYVSVLLTAQVWDLSTDHVGWVGATCRATMIGHMHTVRCLQVHIHVALCGRYNYKTGVHICSRSLLGGPVISTFRIMCVSYT